MNVDNEQKNRNQLTFFNANATKQNTQIKSNYLFDKYVNKEQRDGFNWIEDKKVILEYGCGTGDSLDKFFERRQIKHYHIYGVDIASKAIGISRKKYPELKFYVIKNNKIPQIENKSVGAAFMFHVLHHSTNHEDIFKEIYNKLGNKGKFLINDLSSNNPIISFFRFIFQLSPKFIKVRFSDDLLCEGNIPDKYKVNIQEVIRLLKKCSFQIEELGYGHLFFFVFGWIERFIPLSKISIFQMFYVNLMKLEAKLLKYPFFQRFAEVYYIKATKI